MKLIKTESIAIIGAGNISWHLANNFQKAGHLIKYIYSRSEASARNLQQIIPGTTFTSSLDFSSAEVSFIILAVPDEAIKEIAAQILLPEKSILLHTSGSYPLAGIFLNGNPAGVLYPLQTFTTGKALEMAEVPILIEASDEEALVKIRLLAGSISNQVKIINSELRQKIHLAAVFASNFTNHLLHISYDILKKEGVEFEILKSLIMETVGKSFDLGPSRAQTGPAKRGDRETIENHLKILDYEPKIQEIYKQLSKSITENIINSAPENC